MTMKLIVSGCWDGIEQISIDRYPFVLGRDRETDRALPLAFVSRQHCRFTEENGNVLIQDLESYNGTFVNGRRVSMPTQLHHGDELSLGPLSFRVEVLQPSCEIATKTDISPSEETYRTEDQEANRTQIGRINQGKEAGIG